MNFKEIWSNLRTEIGIPTILFSIYSFCIVFFDINLNSLNNYLNQKYTKLDIVSAINLLAENNNEPMAFAFGSLILGVSGIALLWYFYKIIRNNNLYSSNIVVLLIFIILIILMLLSIVLLITNPIMKALFLVTIVAFAAIAGLSQS